jgi:hypothetical protein
LLSFIDKGGIEMDAIVKGGKVQFPQKQNSLDYVATTLVLLYFAFYLQKTRRGPHICNPPGLSSFIAPKFLISIRKKLIICQSYTHKNLLKKNCPTSPHLLKLYKEKSKKKKKKIVLQIVMSYNNNNKKIIEGLV